MIVFSLQKSKKLCPQGARAPPPSKSAKARNNDHPASLRGYYVGRGPPFPKNDAKSVKARETPTTPHAFKPIVGKSPALQKKDLLSAKREGNLKQTTSTNTTHRERVQATKCPPRTCVPSSDGQHNLPPPELETSSDPQRTGLHPQNPGRAKTLRTTRSSTTLLPENTQQERQKWIDPAELNKHPRARTHARGLCLLFFYHYYCIPLTTPACATRRRQQQTDESRKRNLSRLLSCCIPARGEK